MQKREKVLLILAAMSSITILASNLAAVKLWQLPILNIAVDGGLILFPITYVIGDVIVELYGRKTANTIVWISMILNLIMSAMLLLVVQLPAFPGWGGQEAYASIVGSEPRITIASLVAFLLANLTNNWAFIKIKKRQTKHENTKTGKGYALRAIGSSIPAKLVDTTIFEFGAFFGVLSFHDFLLQATGAFFEGLFFEIILCLFVSQFVVRKLKQYLAK